MTFLPKDYKAPTGSNEFMKLEDGSNRIRVVSDASIGWEGWRDNKPFRRAGIDQNIEEDEVDLDEKFGKPKLSHFWAFKVIDYKDDSVKILQITQKSIMKAIESLVNDSDWGDPKDYDISIERAKNGDKVSYSVKSYPPKKLTSTLQALVDESKIDLNSLFNDDSDAGFGDFKGHIAKPKAKRK